MIKNIKLVLQHPESRAVAMVFMALSMVFGAFVTRLVEIKVKLGLSEAELGTALFFIPLGAATLLPFYSKIISRFGERRTTAWSICVLLLSMILPWYASDQYTLMGVFYLLGLGMGLTDVSMNAEVAEIEKQKSRIIMSTCHGFFSIGGMLGAVISSIFISLSIDLSIQMAMIGVVLIVTLAPLFKHMIDAPEHEAEANKGFELPTFKVLVFAFIGFCVMMSEGGITDWASIYMKENLEVIGQYAGAGFAGFSLMMAMARFQGDSLHVRFGAKSLVLAGSLVAIAGLALVLLQTPLWAIIGFSLAGLGYSVIVPILFSTAAKQEGVKPSKGIATVASSGYIGMLAGPVLIGFIADSYGLVNGFTFLLILTGLAFLMALRAFR
ncbi:hypothetical protein BFP97_01690 [Roseivirga sp. 4D4]|uniref:MFS transporter n=1 Tax=Roseivirga sp. 4D4 TaxID=1889784 RepID=UPI00085298E3|nr:MFS transporter [Roseivirga sp. 4D4]OEK00302.1 hypothetical protein BFP97_01690 [Roseivirga sp. 4D4]